MARDILGGFGPNTPKSQASPARSGGVTSSSDVMCYCPPTGPININDSQSPGIHGTNHGNGQRMSDPRGGGSPSLGGVNNGLNPKK